MWNTYVVQFWQGVVEIILRIVCLVLLIITFICLVVASGILTRKTPFYPIEDLRFNTRSPLGWLLLLIIIDIPITVTFLVLRFLDIAILQDKTKTILCIDVVVNILLAIGIFCGAVPLAKHGTSWKSWRDKGTDELNASYNLNGIVSSIDAASVFAFFSMIAVIVLVVWLALTLALNWGNRNPRRKLMFKVTTV